jgi:hypothetical protein
LQQSIDRRKHGSIGDMINETYPPPGGRLANRFTIGILLIAILVLGGSLRYLAVEETTVIAPIRGDAIDYIHYAYNLKYRDTYSRPREAFGSKATPKPDAVRSPGYPLFIAPFLEDPPTFAHLHVIQLAQALLSTLVIGLIFAISCFVMRPIAALIPTFLTALSPHLVNANIYLLSESLFTFILYTVLLVSICTLRWRHRWLLILCGVLIGLGALVRPTLQFLPLVLGMAYLFALRDSLREALYRSAWVLLGFAIVFSPWVIRNHAVEASGGDQLKIGFLHHGMYPDFRYHDTPESTGYPYRFDPQAKTIARNLDTVTDEIMRRFREEPARHFHWYLFGKPSTYWSWDIVQGMGDSFIYPVSSTPYTDRKLFQTTHAAMKNLHMGLLLLCLTGVALVWLPMRGTQVQKGVQPAAQFLSLVAIYFTLFHMVGAPFPRYAIPVYPLMYLLAALSVYRVMDWYSYRRRVVG